MIPTPLCSQIWKSHSYRLSRCDWMGFRVVSQSGTPDEKAGHAGRGAGYSAGAVLESQRHRATGQAEESGAGRKHSCYSEE